MYQNKKVIVVMPAYNAAATIEKTHAEVIAYDFVDEIIVVDDESKDKTAEIARTLPKTNVFVHPKNKGYGANQKSCYRLALQRGADLVVMIHPDYQYTPLLLPAIVGLLSSGIFPCVLGSRILGGGALRGGMPIWKYISNRFLTLFQNIMFGTKLSEYHTGYRAYTAEMLKGVPFEKFSDDFVFDNQMLAVILWQGNDIGEVTCPTKYFPEASSINFKRSVEYGLGCLKTCLDFRLGKMGLGKASYYP